MRTTSGTGNSQHYHWLLLPLSPSLSLPVAVPSRVFLRIYTLCLDGFTYFFILPLVHGAIAMAAVYFWLGWVLVLSKVGLSSAVAYLRCSSGNKMSTLPLEIVTSLVDYLDALSCAWTSSYYGLNFYARSLLMGLEERNKQPCSSISTN